MTYIKLKKWKYQESNLGHKISNYLTRYSMLTLIKKITQTHSGKIFYKFKRYIYLFSLTKFKQYRGDPSRDLTLWDEKC